MTQEELNKKLIYTSARGNTEQVRELLDAGADIDIQDKFGRTALMLSAAYGRADTVKLLLDAGADIDRSNKYGWTALMQAAMWGHTGVMELLIQAGADVDIRDSDSRTAFDMLKEDHPEQYDQWIRDTAVKHRKANLKREDSTRTYCCTPDYDI